MPIILIACFLLLFFNIFLFEASMYSYYYIVIILYGLTAFFCAKYIRISKNNFLPAFFLLLYSLPFCIILEYLFPGSITMRYRLLTSNLINQPQVIHFIITNAYCGLLGLCVGYSIVKEFSTSKSVVKIKLNTKRNKTLPVFTYVTVSFFLIGLYTYVAPKGNILTNSYAIIRDSKDNFGIGGINYFVYIFLLILFLDALNTFNPKTKRIKYFVSIVSIGYTTIFLNLLKGDRDVAGLIVAVFAVLLYSHKMEDLQKYSLRKLLSTKRRKLLIPFIGFFVVFFFVGLLRNVFISTDLSPTFYLDALSAFYKNGSWMGGYFASLGLSDEYFSNNLRFLYGQTYIDYLLSIPPSFVANWFDYVRPIGPGTGPGFWYMGYTSGGIHPTVVTYKNFGFIGTFSVLGLYGIIIGLMERYVRFNDSKRLFFYGSFILSSLQWVWYGDMYVIRSMESAILIYIIYKFLLQIRAHG